MLPMVLRSAAPDDMMLNHTPDVRCVGHTRDQARD
jgi:hypothetical protein